MPLPPIKIRVAHLAGIISISIGLIVLYGWFFRIEGILRIYPNFAAINPFTAVIYIFAGLALMVFRSKHPALRTFVIATCVLMILLGTIRMLDYLHIITFKGYERLFAGNPIFNLETDRVSYSEALHFIFIGAGLLAFKLNAKRVVIMQLLTIALLLSGVVYLVTYLINSFSLSTAVRLIPFAIGNAYFCVIYAVGMFSLSRKGLLTLLDDEGTLIRKFYNLNISDKLHGANLVLLLGFGTFCVIAFASITNIFELLDQRASAFGMHTEELAVIRSQQQFLNTEAKAQPGTTFYIDGNSKNLEDFESHFSKLRTYGYFLIQTRPDRSQGIQLALNEMSEYREAFYHMVENLKERGIFQYGLEGSARMEIAELQSQLAGDSLILLLKMRKAGSDFVYVKNIVFAEDFDRFAAELKTKLAGNEAQLTLLKKYTDAFARIKEIDIENGLSSNEGLLFDMESEIVEAEPLIVNEGRLVIDATSAQIDLVRVLFSVSVGTLIVAGVITATVNAYFFTGYVRKFRFSASRIAGGDLDRKVKVLGHDEIGDLAITFNKMTDQLSMGYEKLKMANRELKIQSSEDEALLSSIGDGVFAVDLEEKIIMMNNVAEDITGVSFEDAKGKFYRDVVKFGFENIVAGKEYPDIVAEVFKTGKPQHLLSNTIVLRSDKARISVADTASPIVDKQGKIVGCIIVFRDITKEHALERAKDEFISIASHQLRSPIGSMRWNIELLKSGDLGKLDPKALEVVEQLYSTSGRMVSLVNDLLNTSRIEQKRLQTKSELTDLVKIIDEAIIEQKPQAAQKNVTVEFTHEQKEVSTMLDPGQFREVIQNLTSNSIKYNVDQGKVMISLSLTGKKINLVIEDTGLGIPRSAQPLIFTKFYRAPNVMNLDTEGTGLGLYIVKSFIKNFGGKIELHSPVQTLKLPNGERAERGTKFVIEIPIKLK